VKKSHAALYKNLGYTFNDEKLLISALTHRSVPKNNNERLEFFGDSIVNFIAAEIVYHRFKHAAEGELSRLRTMLVRGETLADLAKQLQIGEHLYLGAGELRSGGFRRESILADAMEAVIAAIYLDGGMEICKQCVIQWFSSLVESMEITSDMKDPKTRLQEYLQSHAIALPVYQVVAIEGLAHEQIFNVECYIPSLDRKSIGKGTNRRRAEQQAAENMLTAIKQSERK
jgi:ribonuclease III, bacterial